MANNDPGLRALFKLESDMEFVERVAGKQAVVAALNKMRITVRSRTVKKIYAQTQYLPMVDSKGRKITDKKVKSGLKQHHIRERIRTSRATRYKPYSDATVFVRPIPLIALHKKVPKKQGGGVKTEGQIVRRKSSKTRSTRGGVKIGGRMFPNMFVQFVRKNQMLHIFQRKQRATWKEGTYGWGRAPGTTGKDRMPYDVPKMNLQPIAAKYFPPEVSAVVKERAQIEYTRALNATGARLFKAHSK
jgi:hypothetical protein